MLKRNAFEIVTLLAAAIIISYRLFVPPLVGIADNGDFSRFFTAGLDHISISREDRYFAFFNSKYRIADARRPGRYLSSTEIPIRIAREASVALIDDNIFDIRLVGVLYLLLLLVGMYLVLLATRPLGVVTRVIAACFLLLVLTDACYVSSFNSFYSEPTAFVFFIAAAGSALLAIVDKPSIWLLLTYYAASAGLVTCKPMYAPFALLFATLGVYISRGSRQTLRLGVALAVLLCVTAVVYYSRAPQWLRTNVAFVGIFTDLLPNSPSPAQDLAALGLPAEWDRLIGTTPFDAGSPATRTDFQEEFLGRVGALTLSRFYLLRPARLYSLVTRCSRRILTQTPLGYYEKQSGRAAFSQPSSAWYRIRGYLFPKSVWTVLALFVLGGATAIAGMIRARSKTSRDIFGLYAFVLATAAAQFFVPILSLGEVDLSRYLILFNLIFDVSVFVVPLSIVWFIFGSLVTARCAPSDQRTPA
jgi:hypothetical protein